MSDTTRLTAVLVLPLALLSLGAAALAQPAFRVKDINTTRSDGIQSALGSTFQENLVALGTAVFLGAADGIHGSELWRTDGTEAGTRLVADICPGSCASTPQSLTVVGGQIFFLADDGMHGRALWKSDGTAAGTVLVKELIPEGEFAFINGLTELNGRLLFSFTNYQERHELWRSDGTAAGTVPLASFPTHDPFFYPQPLARLGGKLFFVGDDDVHGRELWTTDGTVAGTVLLKDIGPGLQGGAPGNPEAVVAGGKVLFHAGGAEGFELWGSDGTTAGTVLVKDINPGLGSANLQALTALGPNAYFFASPDGTSNQLWRSDGTAAGTRPVQGGFPFSARLLNVARGRLFFFSGCDLWTSNGTTAGTARISRIASPNFSCDFLPPPIPRGRLFLFFAPDASHGLEPWKSDGTAAGTGPLADLYPGAGSSVNEARPGLFFAGRWYFQAKGSEDAGLQLWTTDGTAAGTRTLRINRQASGFAINARGTLTGPRALFDLNGTTLLFQGRNGASGAELWRSNGTAAGTLLVKDLHPGPGSSLPGEFTRAGGSVFFRSDAGTSVEKLWKTNGTRAGTQLLHAVEQFHNFGFFSPRDLTALGNSLLFLGSCCVDSAPELMRSDGTVIGTVSLSTTPGANPAESIVPLGNQILYQGGPDRTDLWRSDGTSAGTFPLLSGVLSIERFLADSSAARDGVLLFAGSASGSGEELWQSDGTVAGTHLAAEIVPGSGSKRLGPFATTGPVVFFAAGGELWKNDAGGTSLVRALPGNPSVGIRSLTALGGKVYFTYDDGTHGRELWVSDGTAAGTRLFADIQPGAGSSDPRHLHAEGTILLFAASDGVHGVEPWRTDGTAPGTRMIQDIAPGSLPSSPVEFTASGPNIYFVANDGTTGFELWALPRGSS